MKIQKNTIARYNFNDDLDQITGKRNHLHSLDGKPLMGTTTVLEILGKTLTWWASGKAVEHLGWIHKDIKENGRKIANRPIEERIASAKEMYTKIHNSSIEEYISILDRAYENHSVSLDKSASDGTDLHADLEHFVKSMMGKTSDMRVYPEKIKPYIEWSHANVKKYLWSEGYMYSERLWTGGCSDVGAILNDGSIAIIDFKSSKEAYFNHFVQCGGYHLQAEENGLLTKDGTYTARLDDNEKITKYIIVPFGAKNVVPVIIDENIDFYKKAFESCVMLTNIKRMFENQ